jgi:hypothetical protein
LTKEQGFVATAIAKVTEGRKVARPLKALIPLIQSELQQGNSAGHEHYMRAGQMLIEAKDQIAYGAWNRWLTKNFDLSKTTANVYMRWARENEHLDGGAVEVPYRSIRDMTGHTERRREQNQSTQNKRFKDVLRDVMQDRDAFAQERQRHAEEIEAYRELAEKYCNTAFYALAAKLHPDHGGSKNAMAMLNRIHEDMKQYAKTRRFV